MGDYRGFRARRGLARQDTVPRRSDILRVIPPQLRRVRGRHVEKRYLALIVRSPGFRRLKRADARESVLLYARQMARRADHETGTSRPTNEVLMAESDRCLSTIKEVRRRLEDWGFLRVVYPGCKRWYEDPATGEVETRHDAAVYVLLAPRRGARGPAASSALPLNRPPTGHREVARLSPRARTGREPPDGAPFGRAHPGGRSPQRARAGRAHPPVTGAVVAALRKGPGKTLSEGWCAHLSRPFLAAGWTAGDLAHAIEHDQDGQLYPYLTDTVLDPVGWVRWRLARWLEPGEAGLVLAPKDPDTGRTIRDPETGRPVPPELAWAWARPARSRSQRAGAAHAADIEQNAPFTAAAAESSRRAARRESFATVTPAPPDGNPVPEMHLSFWCKAHRGQGLKHRPCRDKTCDSGHGTDIWCGLPCECECHQ